MELEVSWEKCVHVDILLPPTTCFVVQGQNRPLFYPAANRIDLLHRATMYFQYFISHSQQWPKLAEENQFNVVQRGQSKCLLVQRGS